MQWDYLQQKINRRGGWSQLKRAGAYQLALVLLVKGCEWVWGGERLIKILFPDKINSIVQNLVHRYEQLHPIHDRLMGDSLGVLPSLG